MAQMKLFTSIIIVISFGLQAIRGYAGIDVSADQAEYSAVDHVWHECSLPQEEWPDYNYFTNAQQGHYNLTLENMAAFAVKDYALDAGMDNEEWELKRICACEDAYQVYVESKTGNELYILLSQGHGILPVYIIMADIRKGDDEDIILYEGEYSYNSMLEWYSYMDWFDGKNIMQERPRVDAMGDLYDSVYSNGIFYAIYDYLDITDGDKKSHWKIDSNYTYIGRNGYIVCADCGKGVQKLTFLVDVWNKTYAVLIPKEMDQIQEDSEELKAEEESLPETDINIYNSSTQLETNGRRKLIEFPSVDIKDEPDIANLINERIYKEIIPEDFEKYCYGRENVEIQYEIEIVDKEIMSIHFYGYQSYAEAYAECNKGLNFDLQTGKVISLTDYYTLSDIREIMHTARERNEINILDFPVAREEIEQEIDNFVQLFDSEEYANRTDIFFLKDNHIYFIAPPPKSMRHSIYMELSLDKFSKIR